MHDSYFLIGFAAAIIIPLLAGVVFIKLHKDE